MTGNKICIRNKQYEVIEDGKIGILESPTGTVS